MFNIPQKKLPDFVNDKNRLNVLFSPLRNRTVNPKDYDSKIESWKTLIRLYCDCNNIYAFTEAQLSSVFIHNGRPPNCLNAVLQEMVREGLLENENDFFRKSSKEWGSWAADLLIKRPLSWSFNKLRSSVGFSNETAEKLVFKHLLKEKSIELFRLLPHQFQERIISVESLLLLLKDQGNEITLDNLRYLLCYLEKENKVAFSSDSGNFHSQLLKFAKSPNDFVSPITEIDITIYVLEKNEKSLQETTEKLNESIKRSILEAKMHLKQGNNRQMAKHCLLKKHELEKRLEKKLNCLHNIQILLDQLKEAEMNAEVMQTYKKAVAAFNSTVKEKGLTEDNIDDTLIQLNEALEMHNDIETSLAQPPSTLIFDESELERELADLMKSDSTSGSNNGNVDELANQLNDLKLPDAPLSPIKGKENKSFGLPSSQS